MRTSRRAFLRAIAASPALGVIALAGDEQKEAVYAKLLGEYQVRQQKFARDLSKLADECEAAGQVADAVLMRELATPPDPKSLKLDDLPATVQPEVSKSFSPEVRATQMHLRSLREDYANDLIQLSTKCRQRLQMSLAWRLVREAAFENPDQPKARAMLGYVRVGDDWMTPFIRRMQNEKKVWNDRFGWLTKEHLDRYEKGERYVQHRWMSAERAASICADYRGVYAKGDAGKPAWEAVTEHFRVRTNHSLERAVEIAVSLERFNDYFTHTFAAVFMSPQQIQQLFEGGISGKPTISRPHEVCYYADRKEFVATIQDEQPEAAFSNGIYLPTKRTSFFFHKPDAEDEVEETLFHETTHQILSESAKTPIPVGVDQNFWLVEGLACYLESFKPEPHGGSVGDPDHIRIQWAKKYLHERVYVPMGPFTAMGQREFQCQNMPNGPPRVAKLQEYYAQSAGVTHFFMHYDSGAYRDSLITHLSDIYSPNQRVRDRAPTLAELTGVDFKRLDRQYAEHLASLR
jgi:hypothetical protein